MRTSWNKGLTKKTSESLAKTWRDRMKAEGKIKSSYEQFEKSGDLAELIGVVLGDGHLYKHERCESLRITGASYKPEFIYHYAALVETIFRKKPTISKVKRINSMTVTVYEKNISVRLGIPTGSRHQLNYILPEWIADKPEHIIRFLRGLYEAEGTLAFHPGTFTHKFIFTNANEHLLSLVMMLVTGLGYHPHRTHWKIQVSKKDEVQKLADLLQFRHYDRSHCEIV
jgi:hypothetical protein